MHLEKELIHCNLQVSTQPVAGFPSCSTKNKLMKIKTFSWQGFWQVSNVDLCWCSQWVIISAQPAMGEVYIFPFSFSLGRGRATLQDIIYSTTWFSCQRGKRSQPIVQGLCMDWTLRSKFLCLKNVTPPLFPFGTTSSGSFTPETWPPKEDQNPCSGQSQMKAIFVASWRRNFASLWSRIFY